MQQQWWVEFISIFFDNLGCSKSWNLPPSDALCTKLGNTHGKAAQPAAQPRASKHHESANRACWRKRLPCFFTRERSTVGVPFRRSQWEMAAGATAVGMLARLFWVLVVAEVRHIKDRITSVWSRLGLHFHSEAPSPSSSAVAFGARVVLQRDVYLVLYTAAGTRYVCDAVVCRAWPAVRLAAEAKAHACSSALRKTRCFSSGCAHACVFSFFFICFKKKVILEQNRRRRYLDNRIWKRYVF